MQEERTKISSPLPVELRPVAPGDEAFLFALYCSTRSDEMAAWGWAPAQQEMFLKMQYRAQQYHYSSVVDQVDKHIILLDDQPVGRLIVARSDVEFSLDDIALLPEHRGKGIGAGLIESLLAEAAVAQKPVALHVEKTNRAARLYGRLGFKVVADTGMHFKMEWRPEGRNSSGDIQS